MHPHVQASSLEFLASQGFDFNKFVHDGVPYLPAEIRDAKLRGVNQDRDRNRPDIVISKPEDVAFVKAAVERIRAWLLVRSCGMGPCRSSCDWPLLAITGQVQWDGSAIRLSHQS